MLDEGGVGAVAGLGGVDAQVDGEPPLAQHEDAVGQGDRLVDLVGDEQHGRAVAEEQLAHEVLHLDPGEGVEGGERLVEQQQLGLAHQGAGERHPLRLAARQGGRPGAGVVGEPDLVERPGPGRPHRRPVGAAR